MSSHALDRPLLEYHECVALFEDVSQNPAWDDKWIRMVAVEMKVLDNGNRS